MSEFQPLHLTACVLDSLAGQLRAADATRDNLGKIDWSNLRVLIANLLVQFGPVLINLLADRVAPADAIPTPDEPAAQ